MHLIFQSIWHFNWIEIKFLFPNSFPTDQNFNLQGLAQFDYMQPLWDNQFYWRCNNEVRYGYAVFAELYGAICN